MAKYIKCPLCELNYITDGEDLCIACKEQAPRARDDKLSNSQLNGQFIENTLTGYALYLALRGYRAYSSNDNKSTVFWYSNAIGEISEIEGLTFQELEDDIDKLVLEYGPDGDKWHLGQRGKKTWINALCRLKEFFSYRKLYMKK